jgi:hypothetical protein
MLCYAIAAGTLGVHLFYRQLTAPVATRLLGLTSWLFVAVVAYGLYTAKIGMDWFYYQTAADMPSWNSVNKDEYWQLLNSYTGNTTTAFGSLRRLYETWGSGVTLNGRSIFLDVINGLPIEAVKHLTSLGGASFLAVPYGLVMMAAGLALQFRSSYSRLRELKGSGNSESVSAQ